MRNSHNLPLWRLDNIWAFALSIVSTIILATSFYFGIVIEIREMRKDISYMRIDLDRVATQMADHQLTTKSEESRYGKLAVQVAKCCPGYEQ